MASEFLRRVSAAAQRFSDHQIRCEHVVVALLDPEEHSRASVALRESGITQTRYLEAIAAMPRRSAEGALPGHGRRVAPELVAIRAKAEGFAMADGQTTTSQEHLLLAMLWHRSQPLLATELAHRACNVTRRAIVRELVAVGVTIPKAPLPPDLIWTRDARIVARSEFRRLREELDRDGIPFRCQTLGDDIAVYTAQIRDP